MVDEANGLDSQVFSVLEKIRAKGENKIDFNRFRKT